MGVAGSRHRKAPARCVRVRLLVAFPLGGRVENLDGFEVEYIENLLADACAPAIVGMSRNRHAAALFDRLDNFYGGFSAHHRKRGAHAEQ